MSEQIPSKEAIAAASTNQSIQEDLVELWLDNEPNQAKLILGAFKIGITQGEFNTQSAITSATAPLEQRITELEMSLAVAGTETAAYFKGCDETLAGIAGRWKESLEEPIPKPGVMNEPLESLYRRTEQLRQRIKELEQDKKLLLSSLKQCSRNRNSRLL
jgi:hypothetical protein